MLMDNVYVEQQNEKLSLTSVHWTQNRPRYIQMTVWYFFVLQFEMQMIV